MGLQATVCQYRAQGSGVNPDTGDEDGCVFGGHRVGINCQVPPEIKCWGQPEGTCPVISTEPPGFCDTDGGLPDETTGQCDSGTELQHSAMQLKVPNQPGGQCDAGTELPSILRQRTRITG